MLKKNKHPTDSDNEVFQDNPENISENLKYFKKLELQHAILNKLLGSDLKQTTTNNDIEQNWSKPENPSKIKK